MKKIQERLKSLSPEEIEEFHRLTDLAERPIQARGEQCYPLSLAQENIWLLSQVKANNVLFNVPYAFIFKGDIDIDRARSAIEAIVRRHDILRSRFVLEDDRPVCVAVDGFEIGIQLATARDAEAANSLLRAHAARPFDLGLPPLFDVLVVATGGDEHIVQITMHHLITDKWSFDIFAQEFFYFYDHESATKPLPLPPIQYGDYAHWQRRQDNSPAKSHWSSTLSGYEPVYDLPYDYPRPPALTSAGNEIVVDYGPLLTENIRVFARQRGCSVYMLLVAAYLVVYYKYTGGRDICIGSRTAGRNHSGLERVIGYFVNTLALRFQFDGDMTAVQMIQSVKSVILAGLENQDYPIEQVIKALGVSRDLSVNPLFSVMLSFQNTPKSVAADSDLQLQPHRVHTGTAKFEIDAAFDWRDDALVAIVEYSTDLFKERTIRQLFRHHANILAAMIADPQRVISELNPLGEDEVRRQVHTYNDTKKGYSLAKALPELFIERARRHPDRCAYRVGDDELSFGQLNSRSNRIARFLSRQGVGPEALVAVCVDRGFQFVEVVMGVMKAGGAYLPIEPEFPRGYKRTLIEDAQPTVIIAEARCLDEFGWSPASLYSLESTSAASARESAEDIAVPLASENLAYVLYTSGSEGRPKGVMVNHRQILNRIFWSWDAVPFRQGEVVAQKTISTFAVSVWELFGGLLAGVATVIMPKSLVVDPARFLTAIRDSAVTRIYLVPSQLRFLLDQGDLARDCLRSLRVCSVAGEPLEIGLYRQFKALLPEVTLFNEYGSTEFNDITAYDTDRYTAGDGLYVPVGFPVSNTSVYLLDSDLRLLPEGIIGNICIASIGEARGYLNQPGLTASRFLPNPFSASPGGRLYDTGDRGKLHGDGSFELVGRDDNQIKIRGCKVEFREVESALSELRGVRRCAVAKRRVNGVLSLVAYLVAEDRNAVDVTTIVEQLKERLPEFMLPSAYVLLDQLPTLTNGKLDRMSLPDPRPEQLLTSRAFVAPRTQIEKLVASIWQSVLGVARVGTRDNFFVVGGHSLIAADVVAQVRDRLDMEIPLRLVFEKATLAEFAKALQARSQETAGDGPVPLRLEAVDTLDPVPLSFQQQRLWFLEQFGDLQGAYNVSVALKIEGRLDVNCLQRAFNEIVRRHQTLRTRFHAAETGATQGTPELLQRVTPADQAMLTIESASIPKAQDPWKEFEKIAALEASRPFDLERDLMIRVKAVNISHDVWGLMVSLHHIATDAWSMRLLFAELTQLYAAYRSGLESPLTPLPVQYKDYCLWQRRQFLHGQLESQLDYWREQLRGVPELSGFPPDKMRPYTQSYRGARYRQLVDRAVLKKMRTLCQRTDTTLFMGLYAAFALLLSRYNEESDTVVGTTLANRTHTETQPLIGFFANTVVLRTNVAASEPFTTLLTECKRTALGAYANQFLPFERLVDELNPKRDLSYTPLFQVMFSLHGGDEVVEDVHNASVSISQRDIGNAGVAFDVDIAIWQTDRGLEIVWNYCTDLFLEATIARFAEHYAEIIATAASNPEQVVAAMALTPNHWNDTQVDLPTGLSLQDLFLKQARRTPADIALIDAEGQLTYQQLLAEALQLAAVLQAADVRANELVGIGLDKGRRQVIAVLAVLISGAAYVPVDLSWPEKRRADVIGRSLANIVLLEDRCWPADNGTNPPQWAGSCKAIKWSAARAVADHPPLKAGSGANDLAYVIFTSGSTGEPKGVAIQHRAVVNTILDINRRFDVGSGDRVLALSALSFDLSVYDIFGPLARGGAIVLPSQDLAAEPTHWCDLITTHRVTIWNSVPALMEMYVSMLTEAPARTQNPLRLALLSGDWLPLGLVAQLKSRLPGMTAVSLGGATEASIWSIYYEIDDLNPHWKSVPYGRPLGNQKVFVLNSALQHCPPGVEGDLYIGGVGLAQGYWQRPELTQAAFVALPATGERIYRTGDRGRYDSSGIIEFLGRHDTQIKLRGYRIELGEIEHVIASCSESIRDALVMVREDRPGDRRLVAYIVAGENVAHSEFVSRLIHDLKLLLPDYMVPANFVVLDHLPLTPNAKVDRTALPKPELISTPRDLRRPRTDMEHRLCAIWSRVLNTPQVGIADNFFDLGGHSLLAFRVVTTIRQSLGIELPLAVFFQAPTIAKLAQLLGHDQQPAHAATVLPMQVSEHGTDVFCIAGIGATALSFYPLAQALGADYSVYGLQPPGLDGHSPPLTTVAALAGHYLEQIRAARLSTACVLVGHSFGGCVAFEMARQLQLAGEGPASIVLLDTFEPDGRATPDGGVRGVVARMLAERYDLSFSAPLEELAALSAQDQHQFMRDALLDVDLDVSVAQIRGLQDVATTQLNMSYEISEPLDDSRILVCSAQATHAEAVQAGCRPLVSQDDWRERSATQPTFVSSPGSHATMLDPDYVDHLANQLKLFLR